MKNAYSRIENYSLSEEHKFKLISFLNDLPSKYVFHNDLTLSMKYNYCVFSWSTNLSLYISETDNFLLTDTEKIFLNNFDKIKKYFI